MEEEEVSQNSIERTHRLGKRKEDKKLRPDITKFSFHGDKEFLLFNARNLAGTDFGKSQIF